MATAEFRLPNGEFIMSQKRIVITGLGVIAPNGLGKEEFWKNSLEDKNFIKPLEDFDASKYICRVGGKVTNFDAEKYVSGKIIKQTDISAHFAMAACDSAAEDAGLELENEDPYEVGMYFANGFGGMQFAEPELYAQTFLIPRKVSAYQAIAWFYAAAQGQWSISKGIRGFGKSIVGDRAGGHQALIMAAAAIRSGHCRIAFAGGFEAPFVPYIYLIHQTSDYLLKNSEDQPTAYRPFDINRNGMVLAEGGAILILEEYEHAVKRGAKIYAEISGFAMNNDAGDPVQPATDGEVLSKCLKNAVEDAQLTPFEIDHILAEGVASNPGDYTEAAAINSVFNQFGEDTTVSVPKSMIGHSLSAAGAMDAVWACLMMENSIVLPTRNLENPDREIPLNHVTGRPRHKKLNNILCCGRGYGGLNSAFILKNLSVSGILEQ